LYRTGSPPSLFRTITDPGVNSEITPTFSVVVEVVVVAALPWGWVAVVSVVVVVAVDPVCALAVRTATNRTHIIVSNDFIDPFILMLNLVLDARGAGAFKIHR
jgi:hypothetical protein